MCQKSVLSLKFIDIIVYKFFKKQNNNNNNNNTYGIHRFSLPLPLLKWNIYDQDVHNSLELPFS